MSGVSAIRVQLVERLRLGVGAGKAGDVSHQQTDCGVTFHDSGEGFLADNLL